MITQSLFGCADKEIRPLMADTADYKDGILNLILPKSEQEKNKVVKVNLELPAA